MSEESRTATITTGKTLGDVVDQILTSPKRWMSLIALLSSLAGLAMLTAWIFTRLFGVQTRELRFGSTDSHVIFSAIEKASGNEEAVIVVNPQGWQKTSVQVRDGDHISFYANGKICIDVHDILDEVDRRLTYEDQIATELHIRKDDSSETRVPEDYFSQGQRKSLILERPWVDPDGFDLDHFQPGFRSRRGRYLLPDAHAAGLVAAIKGESDGTPTRLDAFFVGKSREGYTVTRGGFLWFTVNDVQFNDPQNPNLFYNDNIGSFWVRVVVTRP